jgi:hypothetical protein
MVTDHPKDVGDREAVVGEEAIGTGPIVELLSAGGDEACDGMATETKQRAQGEGFGAKGNAVLVEEGVAGLPEPLDGGEEGSEVFFKGEGGT